MAKLANILTSRETFRRDLLMALGIWLCLELIAFVVFPVAGVTSLGDHVHDWLLLSLGLGLGGAFVLALCPQYTAKELQRKGTILRHLRLLFWRLLAWVGLAGLAFPLLVLSYELFFALFDHFIEGA